MRRRVFWRLVLYVLGTAANALFDGFLWLVALALAPILFPIPPIGTFVEIPPGGITQGALSPESERSCLELTARVLFHLEKSEASEVNLHYRDDVRIAWITVLFAARGESNPHVQATYRVLGIHPEKVWSAIVERRKAVLGAACEDFFGTASPKKPVRSERRKSRREDRAA